MLRTRTVAEAIAIVERRLADRERKAIWKVTPVTITTHDGSAGVSDANDEPPSREVPS